MRRDVLSRDADRAEFRRPPGKREQALPAFNASFSQVLRRRGTAATANIRQSRPRSEASVKKASHNRRYWPRVATERQCVPSWLLKVQSHQHRLEVRGQAKVPAYRRLTTTRASVAMTPFARLGCTLRSVGTIAPFDRAST
jgi:hypothetical protein